MDHPLVRQTVEDCLHEAMDLDGLLDVLRGLEDGTIERVAIDTPEPSAFAGGILSSQPYTFLDDAPLEERRTQAVMRRRGGLDAMTLDSLGELDAGAVARVREEAWPQPEHAEEVHEVLTWIGYVHCRRGCGVAPLAGGAAPGRTRDLRRRPMEGDRWAAGSEGSAARPDGSTRPD